MSDVCRDLLVAFPPSDQRVPAASPLRERECHCRTGFDRVGGDDRDAARKSDRRVGVYIELDLGMHRVGVPVVDDAIAIARAVRSMPPLEFTGIAFYPGHIREAVGSPQSTKLETLSKSVGEVVDASDRAGLRPTVVSGGSRRLCGTRTSSRRYRIPTRYVRLQRPHDRGNRRVRLGGARSRCWRPSWARPCPAGRHRRGEQGARPRADAWHGRGWGGGFGALLDRPEVIVASMSRSRHPRSVEDRGARRWEARARRAESRVRRRAPERRRRRWRARRRRNYLPVAERRGY